MMTTVGDRILLNREYRLDAHPRNSVRSKILESKQQQQQKILFFSKKHAFLLLNGLILGGDSNGSPIDVDLLIGYCQLTSPFFLYLAL